MSTIILDVYALSTPCLVQIAAVFLFLVLCAYKYRKYLIKCKEDGEILGYRKTNTETGNLTDIAEAGTLHNFLVGLHTKYGCIASFWWGKQLTVSIASPELFKDIQSLFDRPDLLFSSFESLITRDSVQFKKGDDGKKFYNELRKAFTVEALKHYEDTIYTVVTDCKERLLQLQPEDHLPVNQTTFAVAIKVNAMVSFGYMFNDDEIVNKLGKAYASLTKEWENSLQSEKPDIDGEETQFQKDKELMYSTIREAINAHQKNKKLDDHPIFSDLLCDLASDDNEMICNAVTYFIAGFHTTGFLLSWTLYYLSLHPNYQKMVYEEIMEVLGEEKMTVEMMTKLTFTNQVLTESIRCSALGTWGARISDSNIRVGGYKINAGTPILLAFGALHHNDNVWKDPKIFNPHRFSYANVKSRPRTSLQIFGSGKRQCPAYQLSMYEACVFLAEMLRSFKFHLVEGQNVEPTYEFVSKPKEEIWVSLEKRSQD